MLHWAVLDGRKCNRNVVQNQYYFEVNVAKTAVARDWPLRIFGVIHIVIRS